MAQPTRTPSRKGSGRTSSRTRNSGSSDGESRGFRRPTDETDRYRRAAEDALQQLDWAIGYLPGIHKTSISKALAQNRTYIREQLMGEPDNLPSEATDET